VSLEDVRAEAADIGQANAVIQGRGTSTDGKYSDFQVRTETLTPAENQQLQAGLEDAVGATSFGSKNVSESFGRQIASSAILAIVVSLLLIVGYISLRFQWKFAVPVLLALAHDVLITVGIYALLGREVTTATVAAVLTVLGYSIYDTIIIFDRIRENMPLMKRAPFKTIANVSLWETIPRSLATTFITLVPIAALWLFGGDTLKDFAFALLVGIGAGAYSSIFVAAPLLAIFKEREPEYARRREDAVDVSVGGTVLGGAGAVVAEPVEVPVVAARAQPAPAAAGDGAAPSAKRERRRQRRSSRPHGRSR
jgi:SecD/SecF fusion protein